MCMYIETMFISQPGIQICRFTAINHPMGFRCKLTSEQVNICILPFPIYLEKHVPNHQPDNELPRISVLLLVTTMISH